MRVLLIKTSSMGDLIHTLPALTDAQNRLSNITFDWVVEDAFKEIPSWHPIVNQVIPVKLRKWRKNIFSKETRKDWKIFLQTLKNNQYDIVLDAQGLVKSAFLTFFAQGKRVGLDAKSARESLAAIIYQKRCTVNFYQHAIVRMRQLFSQALNYSMPNSPPQFNLQNAAFTREINNENYLVFLHGTTWDSKQWPEEYWKRLADLARQANYQIKISGGSDVEVARAFRIADKMPNVEVLPKLNIGKMAALLANAKGAVSVDTGFGHLAAAINVPTISLYSSTNPEYTGALGNRSVHLSAQFECAPCLNRTCTYREASEVKPACFQFLTPELVWRRMRALANL